MDVDQEQQKLLETHRQRLAVLLEQQATFGVASTPPAVVLGIAEARAEIQRIKAYLRAHGIPVADHLNDDPPPVAALPRPVAVPGSSGGDHVGGDKTTVGTIKDSTDIAIGPGATVDKRSGFFIGRSRIALIIIGVVVLLLLVFGAIMAGANIPGLTTAVRQSGLFSAFPSERPGETLLVIASFHYTEGNRNTAIHEEIRQAILEVLKTTAVPNLRVEIAPEIIAAADRAGAEQVGSHYNASIVIWGEDTGTRVTVNFLNRREPTIDAAEVSINETLRTQIARPEAYASFVTHDLPQQMTFLALFAVGQSAYVREDYPIATQIIRRAVETVQDSLPLADANVRQGVAQAFFRLGWLYQVPGHDNDTQRTLEAYTQAITLDPKLAAAYNNRGSVYADQKQWDKAFADFTQAITLDPKLAAAYYNRGLLYQQRNERDAAIADFRQARDLYTDPGKRQKATNQLQALGAE